MKTLITGASGLLGKYLMQCIPDYVEECKGTYLTNPLSDYEMDIRDTNSIFEVINDFRPNCVIHCAAIGKVDALKEDLIRTNYHGTVYLSNVLREFNSPLLIYVSTNAVYDGIAPAYNETSVRRSVNEYGHVKISVENYLKKYYNDHIIVRPYMLFGWPYEGARQNWASIIVEKLNQGGALNLVNDVKWQPTYAGDCAQIIWEIIRQRTGNSFNISSGETVTLYEFGLMVCDIFGLNSDMLTPVDSSDFLTMEKRPRDTSYDLHKLKVNLGYSPLSILEGLSKMKGEK